MMVMAVCASDAVLWFFLCGPATSERQPSVSWKRATTDGSMSSNSLPPRGCSTHNLAGKIDSTRFGRLFEI